jgi:hypothetical protein
MNDSNYNFKLKKTSISTSPISILRPEFIAFAQNKPIVT